MEDYRKNEKKEKSGKAAQSVENVKKGSPILTLAIIICLVVMAYSGYRLVHTLLDYKQSTDEYAELQQFVVALEDASEDTADTDMTETVAAEPTSSVSEEASEKASEAVQPPLQVDWKSLKAINEDVIGWIYIGSLNISYPVVQGEDNDYYLHRTFERTDNFAGSIFVEYQNSALMDDPNTIVYGHNMKNQSMFGSLAQIQSKQLYESDPYFWILTPRGNYRYRMFSIRKAEVSDETYTLFTGTDQLFVDWCERMYQVSEVALEKPVFTEDSLVVTLSTCTTDSGHRFVVQGIQIPD